MPYSRGPYSLTPDAPRPRPKLVSSRLIDFATKTYVVDADGNPEAMPSTAQRVLLLVSYATDKRPAAITPQALNEMQDRTRKALRVLTDGPAPRAKLQAATVERSAAGAVLGTVDFEDLTAGLDGEVTL